MSKKLWLYVVFFALLLLGFYLAVFRDYDFSKSNLAVRIDNVQDFSFVNQNGKMISNREVEGKVYAAEYFFTTCKGICPKMNANMRRVYDVFKNDSGFAILSHTCMPETDSVPLLKDYEQKMLTATIEKNADGSYRVHEQERAGSQQRATNWFFLTGNKRELYKMARQGYLIDDNRRDTTLAMGDQFIHTQFFSLVDKQGRVRGIYDGTKTAEVDKMIGDIKDLMKEKSNKSNFLNNMGNTPN